MGVGVPHIYDQGYQGQEHEDGCNNYDDRLAMLVIPWHSYLLPFFRPLLSLPTSPPAPNPGVG